MTHRANPLIRNKLQDIPSRDLRPHYSDPRFWRDRIGMLTVFLAEDAETYETSSGTEEVRGLNYLASDRLAYSTDYETHSSAWAEARQLADSESNVIFFENYLARILGRETVDIQHILSTVKISSDGNSMQYFGITEPE